MCRWAGNGRSPAHGVRRGLLRRGCEGSRCSGSASAAVLDLPGGATPFPGRFRRRGVAPFGATAFRPAEPASSSRSSGVAPADCQTARDCMSRSGVAVRTCRMLQRCFLAVETTSSQLPLMLLGPAVKSVLGILVLISALKYWPDLFETFFLRSMVTADHLLHLAR